MSIRTGRILARNSAHSPRRVQAFAGTVGAVLLLGAAPALANKQPPKYTLSIVEGETTLPEYSIAGTGGGSELNPSVAVSITRGGTVVAKSTGTEHSAGMSQTPQTGDVVSLESPIGTTIGSVVYDGLPSIDPTVCAGSTNFSGHNSTDETVKGSAYTETAHRPYGPEQTGFGRAQVTILSGTSFGGSFLSPLTIGQTVSAVESLETPIAGGAVFDYTSETVRPVSTCPPPPPPPPPPPLPPAAPALQGGILKLTKITIKKLLKSGWLTAVTINQPGTVTEDLYLKDGTVPAFASSVGRGKRHHKRKPPPALLIARGTVTAKSAGKVDVLIRATAKGRKVLKHARSVKAVLVITLSSPSGAKLTIGRRTVSLRR